MAAAALLGAVAVGWPGAASGFCGFFVSGADAQLYNNATQVALLRKGNHTVLTMSNNYKGPPEDFAMVVPVPVVLKKEQVKTLSADVFRHIDQLSAPRLVEYWEQDPCNPYTGIEYAKNKGGSGGIPALGSSVRGRGSYGVTIEAQFEVGEYQIVILSAKDSTGLDRWLRDNRYKIPQGAAEALAPYVRDQMKFFVAKVDIKKVRRDDKGLVVLSPLRFGFDAAELRLPVRLGLLNAESKQDLLVYVLHPTDRFEVANYPNVFIPTNIEVADAVRKSFPSFYAELFDETLRRANGRAVITEYAWQTSGCDPCPTPPLSESDLYTLGDEQIFPGAGPGIATDANTGGGKNRGRIGVTGGPGGFFGSGSSWVLTRLHTRYDQKTLTDDLIFRTAKPAVGGRANWSGGLGDQGGRIEASGPNNFQGRYIIRHYWEGGVTCDKPMYGVWGGPPGSVGGNYKPAARAAGDLAGAARGKIKLSEVVTSPLPELGLSGTVRPLRKGEQRANPETKQ